MDRRQREMLDIVELEMTEIYYDEEEKVNEIEDSDLTSGFIIKIRQ